MTAPFDLPRDPRALYEVWNQDSSLTTWQTVRTKAQAADDANGVRVAEEVLDELAATGASPLRALAANVELVKLLTGWRWIATRDAREQGATWDQIAEVLALPDAEAARAWYLAKIQRQERYAADFHDAPRARAVLDEHEEASG